MREHAAVNKHRIWSIIRRSGCFVDPFTSAHTPHQPDKMKIDFRLVLMRTLGCTGLNFHFTHPFNMGTDRVGLLMDGRLSHDCVSPPKSRVYFWIVGKKVTFRFVIGRDLNTSTLDAQRHEESRHQE